MKDFGKSHVLPSFSRFYQKVKSWHTSHHQMLLTMKLTIVLMTVGLLQVTAGAFSQKVTVVGSNLTLKEVFTSLRKQAGYNFFYDHDILNNAKNVTLNVKDGSVEDVLEVCFADQPLSFKIEQNTVFVSARGYSQEKITLNEKDAPLEKVLKEITKQTGYHFVFTDKQLEGTGPVTIKVTNAAIQETLDQCFKDQPLTWELDGNAVLVNLKKEAAQAPAALTEDSLHDVKGKIVDEKGEPIAGATVTVKGTKRGTVTNEKGEFELHNVPSGGELVISHVGYEKEEIKEKGKEASI